LVLWDEERERLISLQELHAESRRGERLIPQF
jgi:hypothetical protein